jgi:2-dehydropantoate 2-reductase
MTDTTHAIAVVGSGAVGCLFGAMLREAGHRVIMLDTNAERVETIASDGIHITGISGEKTVSVEATAKAGDIGECDVAVIATKSYDTADAVDGVAGVLKPSTPVLTLQNGLGNVEVIRDAVGDDRTIGGITAQGATLAAAGSIVHAGRGKTVIGTPANRLTDNLELVRSILESAGFEPEVSGDLEGTIWNKLIINVGINALTAVTRLNNGRLIEFEGTHQIMKDVVAEAVEVAKAHKIKVALADPLGQVEEVCRLTATNIASMLQDVLARRHTEIDAINGAIARLGEEAGIPTPINAALAALVRTIESSYDLEVSR